MKLEPLDSYTRRPVAILNPGRRCLEVTTEDGTQAAYDRRDVEALLEGLTGHLCYVLDALPALIHTTGALSWQMHLWHGRETRATYLPLGLSVSSLRGILEPSSAFDDVARVHGWLKGYGVSPGSIPAMAWGLFRASLSRSYSVGFDPEVGRSAFFGGRQEATRPGIYDNMQSVDIEAAYPAAMARPQGYALTLREVSPATNLDPTLAGLARARVTVPDEMPYAPLPVRLDQDVISYQRGTIEGTWAWCELAAAAGLGATVTVLQSWAPARSAELFGPWWPLADEGRHLAGGAGRLAKAISNSTWGQFGMRAEGRATRTFADEAGQVPVDVEYPDHDLPHSWAAHVAAETTARVRTQMLTEGLYGGAPPVHVDTDGVIVPAGSLVPGNGGKGPGQWRVKADIPLCDIRGPQLYRWTCPGCGVSHEHWHYNASGIPAADAPGYFEGDRVDMIEVERRGQW